MSEQTKASVPKPLPVLEGFAKEFYAGCARGELLFQRCSGCETWRFVPREMCAKCGSFDFSWQASCGRGRVYTWTVIERPLHPAFADAVPLAAVVVELEEGVRLLSHVIDCPPEALEMEMPVKVVFEARSDNVTLPLFRRAKA